jgi:hypothetical protein
MKTHSIKTTFGLETTYQAYLPTCIWIELNWIQINWMEFGFNSIQFNFSPNKFNSNLVELNSTIGLRFNWREWDQISGEGSENFLVNTVLEVFKKKT